MDVAPKPTGLIYKITCKTTNKSYVGETTKTAHERIENGHFRAAKYKFKEGCLALNAAIRQYGRDSFVYEVVHTCPSEENSKWEIHYIKEFNTLAPNGYNLHAGGRTPIVMSEESKLRHSQNRREYYKDQELPMFVQHLTTKFGEGYIYYRDGYKRVQFCSKKLTMDQKRQLIVEYAKNPIKAEVGGRSKVSYVVNADGTVNVKIPKYE